VIGAGGSLLQRRRGTAISVDMDTEFPFAACKLLEIHTGRRFTRPGGDNKINKMWSSVPADIRPWLVGLGAASRAATCGLTAWSNPVKKHTFMGLGCTMYDAAMGASTVRS
jgi:hypothetical protein